MVLAVHAPVITTTIFTGSIAMESDSHHSGLLEIHLKLKDALNPLCIVPLSV